MQGRMTRKMKAAMERHGPLERAVPELVHRMGKVKAAHELGISHSSLDYWMLKLGMRQVTLVLTPGQRWAVLGPGGAVVARDEERQEAPA